MINPNNPLTLIEAAKLMGVSTQTVRRLIQRKVLAAQQSVGPHGLRWEIDRADLLRYLEEVREVNNPYQQVVLTTINTTTTPTPNHHRTPTTRLLTMVNVLIMVNKNPNTSPCR